MIAVSEEQALYFRALRGHLAGPGARDALTAASDILGAQAQQPGPGMMALSQRVRRRPRATQLKKRLLGDRSLVRTWGQRETLHIYAPGDWRLVAAARAEWAPAGRRGPMPSKALLAKGLARLTEVGSGTRDDVIDLAPESYLRALREFQPKYIPSRDEARRFAAGRILWCLSMRGDVCVADKQGQQQAYAARSSWFPELPWPPLGARAAAVELTRRYLRAYGPASAKDVGHHFGARLREAKAWLDDLREAGELEDVDCGDRKGLVVLAEDATALQRKPPKKAAEWPLRLLPQWDTYLMGHADKSWTVPDDGDRKRVWRGQAVVAASIVHRGRVIGEWLRGPKKTALEVGVVPLSGWTAKRMPAVKREVNAIAAHLGLERVSVEMA